VQRLAQSGNRGRRELGLIIGVSGVHRFYRTIGARMEEPDKVTRQATDSKGTEIQLSITAAELCKNLGDHGGAETQYLRALELARASYDEDDANVGLILMDLLDIYELQGRNDDVLRTEQEIAAIGRRHFFKMLAYQAKSRHE
jgi:Tetratricopeptide repeat